MFLWIILFSILGSVGALCAAAGFVFLAEKHQKSLVANLIAFATGVLLAAAFLGLIPEAIESVGDPALIMPFILGGILLFFFLEKIILWRNCRDESCEVHSKASGPIILIGDTFHNFTDGIVIAVGFLISFTVGVTLSLTIIVHEIASETSDFGILLHSGLSKKKAFIYNTISSLSTILAAVITFFVIGVLGYLVPYFLALSAASFIYLALSDLTPDLHKHTDAKYMVRQLLLIIAGIVLIWFLLSLEG